MRIPYTHTFDPETMNNARSLATKLQVSVSELLDLSLRLLETHPEETLQTWARTRQNAKAERRERRLNPIRASELTAKAALGTDWLEFTQLRVRTGQTARIAWRALQALRTRGLVEAKDYSHVGLVNGVPRQSFWRLK